MKDNDKYDIKKIYNTLEKLRGYYAPSVKNMLQRNRGKTG